MNQPQLVTSPDTFIEPPPPVAQIPGFEEKKKKPFFTIKRIAAIGIGTLIGIPLMLVGFIRFQSAVLTRASDITPRDVVISETTTTEATVHWSTGEPTQGTILYGTEPTTMRLLVPEQGRVLEHSVTIPLLAPGTTYYFTIRIGDEIYNNGGEPWAFTTKALDNVLPTPTINRPTSGTCPQTDDCNQIQQLMRKGCTVTDYVQCVKRKE